MEHDRQGIARLPLSVPWTARCTLLLFVAWGAPAFAQKVHNTYGSPLDTLKNSHFTTDVPQAKDFVRETSPDKSQLDYTPLTGSSPDRPKPRDPKQVDALRAELESAGARNDAAAKGLLKHKSTVHRSSRSAAAAGEDGTAR